MATTRKIGDAPTMATGGDAARVPFKLALPVRVCPEYNFRILDARGFVVADIGKFSCFNAEASADFTTEMVARINASMVTK